MAVSIACKIIDGEIVRRQRKDLEKSPSKRDIDGNLIWRPLVEQAAPSYDPQIERLVKSETIERNRVLISYTKVDIPLADLKATYKARVNSDAERERLLYLTDGAGQAAEYREAHAQAVAYLADNSHTPVNMLQAGVDAGEAANLTAEANLVITRYTQWEAIGASIRTQRLTALIDIEDANNANQVIRAYEAIEWPSEASE